MRRQTRNQDSGDAVDSIGGTEEDQEEPGTS